MRRYCIHLFACVGARPTHSCLMARQTLELQSPFRWAPGLSSPPRPTWLDPVLNGCDLIRSGRAAALFPWRCSHAALNDMRHEAIFDVSEPSLAGQEKGVVWVKFGASSWHHTLLDG